MCVSVEGLETGFQRSRKEGYFPLCESPGKKNERLDHRRVLPQVDIEKLVIKLVGIIGGCGGEYQIAIPFFGRY